VSRAVATALLVSVGTLAAPAGAAAPQVTGSATIGGSTVALRYARAFLREASGGASGGWAIVLSPAPVRCRDLRQLPASNPLHQPWALVALYASKDGLPQTGAVSGEIDYPVGDAYASLARGTRIVFSAAQPFPGGTWRGRALQQARTVEGKRYALNVHFTARWCAT
jgi:hypothetical protein